MRDRSHYFAVKPDVPDTELLHDWRWLLGPRDLSVERVTAMGNLFLRDDSGAVHFLDIADGRLRRVAESANTLDALFESTDNRRTFLWSFLVRELRNDGILLEPGQCYGWKVPPCLGGEPDSENIEPSELVAYLSLMGQVQRQARELPEGTKIDDVRIELPPRPFWRRLFDLFGGK